MLGRTALCLVALVASAEAQEPLDEAAVEYLREQGLEHSQVMDHLSWICDVHGPRLTGSKNLEKAQAWALETFQSWGLANGHLEEWGPFGDGWHLDRFSLAVLGDNPWPVHGYPKAWSPELGAPVEAEVVDVSVLTADEVRAMDLSDKIVLVQSTREVSEPFDGLARRFDSDDLLGMASGPGRQVGSSGEAREARANASRFADFRREREVLKLVYEKQPLAILDRSYKGDYGTIFATSASVPTPEGVSRSERPRAWRAGDARVVPQFTLAVEHYNRIARLLAKGVPVRMRAELEARFFRDDPMERNVLAEIPGTDPEIGDEVVMLGAHFDSWHAGTGASDNGCGSAVMMEAIRLLAGWVESRGEGPRRTIRIALWSGEEQGLLGSRAYVSEHYAVRGGRGEPPAEIKPAHDKVAGYFNLDNGTGRVRGIYAQQNVAVMSIFRTWLSPFHDLDARTVAVGNTGGTDHLAFDAVGLPGFQFIQDPVAYSPRTHHSNMDNWDHAVAEDLRQAATIIASFVWHTAQRDERLPRKPLPAPR